MKKIICVKGLSNDNGRANITEVDVIMLFVSVAVTLHVYFFNKSDTTESWDSGATGQLRFWQYTGVLSGTVNTVRHSYLHPPTNTTLPFQFF